MNFKLPLFSILCVLAFAKATARLAPSSPSLIENLNAAAVSANVKEDDYAPPPPAMLKVEGPDIKDGTALRRWIYCIGGTVLSCVCIGLYKSKPKTLRHNRLFTLLIFILNALCWIPNIVLNLTEIPSLPYIPWTMDVQELENDPPNPPVDPPAGPSVDPPTPTAVTPRTAVTPQRSPIYDWLRLPRKAAVCPACKRTAADLYVPNHCTQCGIGSSRVNCGAAQVLESSGFAH